LWTTFAFCMCMVWKFMSFIIHSLNSSRHDIEISNQLIYGNWLSKKGLILGEGWFLTKCWLWVLKVEYNHIGLIFIHSHFNRGYNIIVFHLFTLFMALPLEYEYVAKVCIVVVWSGWLFYLLANSHESLIPGVDMSTIKAKFVSWVCLFSASDKVYPFFAVRVSFADQCVILFHMPTIN